MPRNGAVSHGLARSGPADSKPNPRKPAQATSNPPQTSHVRVRGTRACAQGFSHCVQCALCSAGSSAAFFAGAAFAFVAGWRGAHEATRSHAQRRSAGPARGVRRLGARPVRQERRLPASRAVSFAKPALDELLLECQCRLRGCAHQTHSVFRSRDLQRSRGKFQNSFSVFARFWREDSGRPPLPLPLIAAVWRARPAWLGNASEEQDAYGADCAGRDMLVVSAVSRWHCRQSCASRIVGSAWR